MKSFKPRQIIKVLEHKGFSFVRQKGSHRLYKKGNIRVTVPYHNKDLKPGTLKSIMNQANLKDEDL